LSTPLQVWSYRNLITNLAQRDLKARYKRSVLGWLWSLINPAATLGIYTLVFGVFLKGVAPEMGSGHDGVFALFLFSGLVAWNLFAGIVNGSITAFFNAGPLLTRTYFPPECPMLATVAAVVLQSLLEVSILAFFMIVVGNISWTFLVFIPVFALLACFALGVGLVLAVLNIRYRDVAYLTGILLQLWFYATPIVYSLSDTPDKAQRILQLNPLNAYVNAMRRGTYYLDLPTLTNWIVMVASASISLAFGWWLFSRLAPRVIEEL
jgi:ABC-type polysaccharide/polyol phosphate export permease